MRIETVETLACDAGWRNYNFVKITTDTGVVGWSEYDESFGPRGITAVIENYARQLIGEDPMQTELHYARISPQFVVAPFGLTAEALGALENALLDVKARALDIPVYELLGGRVRETIPIYWSHLPTWQIGHSEYYEPKINRLEDLRGLGAKVRDSGLMGLKSNLFEFFDDRPPVQWHPGFGNPHEPGANVTRKVIKDTVDHLEMLREGAGPDVELGLDINFDAKTEGTLKLLRAVEHLDLFWFELDNNNPDAMAYIRSQGRTPIASCETLTGVRQLLPYLQKQAVDVAIIDVVWNGAWQALKMASAANAFDVNVAPHNFYGHLATMMSVHFAAAVPNLRIMEHDIDRLPWDDEIFIGAPKVVGSEIIVPDGAGWGVVPNEQAFTAHPARDHSYLDH